MSDDEDLTGYLWPVVCEMIKTAIENEQNLIVEGCYVPFDWKKDFTEEYLENIKYYCFVMSEDYIRSNFDKIRDYSNVIEKRLEDDLLMENVIGDNKNNLEQAKKYNVNYVMIEDESFYSEEVV